MSQRAIRRATGVGTQRAKRLAELAGWAEPPTVGNADNPAAAPQVHGQLQLVAEPGKSRTDAPSDTDADSNDPDDFESSSSR